MVDKIKYFFEGTSKLGNDERRLVGNLFHFPNELDNRVLGVILGENQSLTLEDSLVLGFLDKGNLFFWEIQDQRRKWGLSGITYSIPTFYSLSGSIENGFSGVGSHFKLDMELREGLDHLGEHRDDLSISEFDLRLRSTIWDTENIEYLKQRFFDVSIYAALDSSKNKGEINLKLYQT